MQTFAVYVDNKPGVLNRVASLFRRRAFNIESLTVGHTETPGVSRMTVVVDTDEYGARRLEAHLHKLVPVRRVDHHLGDEVVVLGWNAVARLDRGVDPNARPARPRRSKPCPRP